MIFTVRNTKTESTGDNPGRLTSIYKTHLCESHFKSLPALPVLSFLEKDARKKTLEITRVHACYQKKLTSPNFQETENGMLQREANVKFGH